jgi:hypothetical protein
VPVEEHFGWECLKRAKLVCEYYDPAGQLDIASSQKGSFGTLAALRSLTKLD